MKPLNVTLSEGQLKPKTTKIKTIKFSSSKLKEDLDKSFFVTDTKPGQITSQIIIKFYFANPSLNIKSGFNTSAFNFILFSFSSILPFARKQ